jgi:hypothetical protein
MICVVALLNGFVDAQQYSVVFMPDFSALPALISAYSTPVTSSDIAVVMEDITPSSLSTETTSVNFVGSDVPPVNGGVYAVSASSRPILALRGTSSTWFAPGWSYFHASSPNNPMQQFFLSFDFYVLNDQTKSDVGYLEVYDGFSWRNMSSVFSFATPATPDTLGFTVLKSLNRALIDVGSPTSDLYFRVYVNWDQNTRGSRDVIGFANLVVEVSTGPVLTTASAAMTSGSPSITPMPPSTPAPSSDTVPALTPASGPSAVPTSVVTTSASALTGSRVVSPSHQPVLPIAIGCAAGGVVLIALVIVIVVCRCRSRNRSSDANSYHASTSVVALTEVPSPVMPNGNGVVDTEQFSAHSLGRKLSNAPRAATVTGIDGGAGVFAYDQLQLAQNTGRADKKKKKPVTNKDRAVSDDALVSLRRDANTIEYAELELLDRLGEVTQCVCCVRCVV